MIPPVDTKDPVAVARFVRQKQAEIYGKGKSRWLDRVYKHVTGMFSGQHPDYAAIDLHYHDFEHTLQATVCLVLILEGRHRARSLPRLKVRQFELAVAAILLHDIGYLHLRSDRSGTGAKYTFIHELRSNAYAASYLPTLGTTEQEVAIVVAAISSTGPKSNIRRIEFSDEIARFIACAVTTADYLAQMAAPDYLEQLPSLHAEFQESYDFFGTPKAKRYSKSAHDLIRRTPQFWNKLVLPKLKRDFEGVYHFLASPYPLGANPYLDAIEANLAKLKRG